MDHSCQYLCSELVTVTYEEQPGEIRQATANLEEISTTCAVVLLEEKPRSVLLSHWLSKDRDLFGVIKASLYDAGSGLVCHGRSGRRIAVESRLVLSATPARDLRMLLEGATRTKARTLENTRNTEENVPVSFVVSEA